MLRALFSHLSRIRPTVELDPLTAYNLWAANYPPEAHNPLMRAEETAMLDLLPADDLRGRRALDLACGSGRYLRWLKASGAAVVVGLDLSAAMLAHARLMNLTLLQATMLALPLATECFDLVVCGLAVGHTPDLAAALREMARALRPGGLLVYSDFHPFGHFAGWKRGFRANGRDYAVFHHLHLYADHHAACLNAGLTIEAVREPFAVDDAALFAAGHTAWGHRPVALVIRARKS